MENIIPAKIYGLLGYPVAHSLSPSMHNAAFKACSINAEYKLFPVKPEGLEEFLSWNNLKAHNIFGLNVTMPYKEKVIPYINGPSSYTVRLTQAANTIKIYPQKEEEEGFSTDGIGFCWHLQQELKFDYSRKRVAIIGAGGAAKAVSASLAISFSKPVMEYIDNQLDASIQPASITIYDVDKIKASKWAEELGKEAISCEIKSVESIEEMDIKNQDLLINATPVGMRETDPSLIEPDMLGESIFVYDLIYSPPQTKLLNLAREKGLKSSNGLGMLLYQGASAFNIFTGVKPPVEIMRQALFEALK